MSAPSKGRFEPRRQHLMYVIDLDERGYFQAHVQNDNGTCVYKLNNEDSDDGSLWLVTDGFMKHAYDHHGLHKYLQSIGIAKPTGTISVGR
ncbi:MAG: hypothetical protein ING66_04235 [Rhodocyclaceae bacterium]|jgi:hypothetical protein|nr:hypothetical protein [Rhodocyclaceae bacterium]MCA3026911.1 hypothetical protein [Rhodocyclaceae bacterium]MCA3027788.1 hypothetical protein [Rhodocyclaceae bacterium]MCA3031741.1 hypothetical protein [Rhodocyclaceae bacterium]MCA3038913.1 hypothetical protein [Rhodocyclaceae bacterium]